MSKDNFLEDLLVQDLKDIEQNLIDPVLKERISGLQPTPFKTVEKQISDIRDQYIKSFKESLDLIQKSSHEVFSDPAVGIVLPSNYEKSIRKMLTEMKAIQATIKNKEYDKLPKEMPSLQKALKIPPETMERLYQTIYDRYQNQDYESAVRRCLFAINLNAAMPNFWSMMAACEEKQEHWVHAGTAYLMAALLEPMDIGVHISVLRCLIRQDKRAEAADYGEKILDFYIQNNNQEEKALFLKALAHFKLA